MSEFNVALSMLAAVTTPVSGSVLRAIGAAMLMSA